MSFRNWKTSSTSLWYLRAGHSKVSPCGLGSLTWGEFLVQDAGSLSLSSWVASLRSRDRNKSSWIQKLESVGRDSRKEGGRLRFSAGIPCRFLAEAWAEYIQGESVRGWPGRRCCRAESRREMRKVGEWITIIMLSTFRLHLINASLLISVQLEAKPSLRSKEYNET